MTSSFSPSEKKEGKEEGRGREEGRGKSGEGEKKKKTVGKFIHMIDEFINVILFNFSLNLIFMGKQHQVSLQNFFAKIVELSFVQGAGFILERKKTKTKTKKWSLGETTSPQPSDNNKEPKNNNNNNKKQ